MIEDAAMEVVINYTIVDIQKRFAYETGRIWKKIDNLLLFS